MEASNGHGLNILLADDDPDDRMFFSDAVSALSTRVNLSTVNDGAQLMSLLLNQASILPHILFLDLNMPFKNGFECLQEIRGNSKLKDLFVVIYSTTSSSKEISETFKMGANLFVNKPNSFTELKSILAKILALNLQEYSHPEKEKFVLDTY